MEVGVNSKPLDDEEIGRIKDDISIVPEKTLPTLTFLMPFLLVEGDQVKISKTEMIVDTTDDSGNKLKPSYSYVGCLKYSGLKAGREIIPGLIDPKAKSFELFKFPSVNRDGQEFFGGVLIRIERTDGIKYQISFIAPDDRRSLASLDIANNAPLADPDKNKFLSQKGVEITGTTSIMRTNIDGAIINEYMSIISMPNVSSSMPFFSEVQFFQSLDKKALYIPKK